MHFMFGVEDEESQKECSANETGLETWAEVVNLSLAALVVLSRGAGDYLTNRNCSL